MLQFVTRVNDSKLRQETSLHVHVSLHAHRSVKSFPSHILIRKRGHLSLFLRYISGRDLFSDDDAADDDIWLSCIYFLSLFSPYTLQQWFLICRTCTPTPSPTNGLARLREKEVSASSGLYLFALFLVRSPQLLSVQKVYDQRKENHWPGEFILLHVDIFLWFHGYHYLFPYLQVSNIVENCFQHCKCSFCKHLLRTSSAGKTSSETEKRVQDQLGRQLCHLDTACDDD